MPTSVYDLFQKIDRNCYGPVKWGQTIDCNNPGVYVVALSPSSKELVCIDSVEISKSIVQKWIDDVPALTLDHFRPTSDELIHRLQGFWLPDETILYIGKAGKSLKRRVNQYYKHILGEPKPHRGGHWIKTLDNLVELSVYWAASQDETAHDVESRCLKVFIDNVSVATREKLIDAMNSFPFANLEFPKGVKKNHNLQNQVNPRS